jgi:hypothetical protein
MPEVIPNKAKKPCKLGSNARSGTADHPAGHETNKPDGDSKSNTQTTETSCQQHDSICLPFNVSDLLQSLTITNETMIEAIASNSIIISKRQSENAQLMNVAQNTRRDLHLLQDQVEVHLEQQ